MGNSSASGKLVLVIGPSGVGKSVVLRELKKRHTDLVFPRSATTRARRPGEGEELYRFVSENEFDALIRDGKLIEWAVVHGGARYGTLRDEILPAIEEGKIVVREVDVQGFHSIRADAAFAPGGAYPMQSLFILPQNKEQLIARIVRRAPISDEELKRRIESMDTELKDADLCDAQIVNEEGKLQQTIEELEGVIFEAIKES